MKTILRIARLELQVMFFSPVAWLISLAFSIESAIYLCDHLHGWVMRSLRGEHPDHTSFWTYAGSWGLFHQIEPSLSLYVALLTMGVFSREFSSGSMKLLQSAPVRSVHIVAGKYLGLLVYGFLLMCVTGLLVAVAGIALGEQDYGLILTGMFGLFLLIAAYMAIGLLMSSLTPHQAVAAICTFALIALLQQVGLWGQQIALWREVSYFLAIGERTTDMSLGILSSKDLAYFVIVSILFLGIAVIRLDNERLGRSRLFKAVSYVVFAGIMLGLGYLSTRPGLIAYADCTLAHMASPTPVSQSIFKKVKGPVRVHIYVNVLDEWADWGMPWNRRGVIDLFASAQPYLPPIEYDWTYFYDSVSNNARAFHDNANLSLRQLAMKLSSVKGLDTNLILTPAEMRRRVDLRGEEHRLVMEVEACGRKAFLRHYETGLPDEPEIAAVFKRLVQPGCVIGFVTGHGERSIDKGEDDAGYKYFFRDPDNKGAMFNQGFDVMELGDGDVSSFVDILVIADPLTPYGSSELAGLRRYIARGGNLLIAGEPGRKEVLDSIGGLLGVRFGSGALVQGRPEYSASFIRARVSRDADRIVMHRQAAARSAHLPTGVVYPKDVLDMYIDAGMPVEMAGAMALDYAGGDFIVDSLLVTDTASVWRRVRPVGVDTGLLRFQPELGDERRVFACGLALRRAIGGKEQRIVVLGDADCLANQAMRHAATFGMMPKGTSNYVLGMEVLRWMSGGEYPVDEARPDTPDHVIRIDRAQFKLLRLLLEWVVPGLMLVGAVWLLVGRRRK